MRLVNVFLAFFLLLLCSFRTPAQDHFEVFGGYSFVQATVPIITDDLGTCEGPSYCQNHVLTSGNLNGWEVAGTLRPKTWFGVTADFSGQYGTDKASNGNSSAHLYTFLFGPKIAYPGRVSPFFHVLVGAAHAWTGNGYELSGTTIPSSQTAFATALGGGIDIKLNHLIALRPVQFDYLLTRFDRDQGLVIQLHNLVSSTQNEFRASAGIVFNF